MKALVTGGGGFLGSCIVRMLQARGDEVLVLGRRKYPHHDRAGIPTIIADLRDAAAVENACRGVDVVFHAGAMAGIWGKKRAFWETNVGGTRNVIDACRTRGVGRLVFTSSPSVVFGEGDLNGVDESHPYPNRYTADYPRSKAVAERLVLSANCPSLATVALRPHLIWGPGDPHLIPRVVDRARRGKLVQVGGGRNLVDITYIDNAAEAHLLAADALSSGSKCAGRAYFISQGDPVELWPWLNGILDALDIPRVSRSVSYRTARTVGAALELMYMAGRLGGEPPMTRFLASQLAKNHYFSIRRAAEDFGYLPSISIEEGMRRLVQSLRTRRPSQHSP